MPELSVAFSTPNNLAGSYENMIVQINKTSIPSEVFDRCFAVADALVKRYPDGVGYMCVMFPGTSAPDAAGRQKINSWMNAFAPKHMKLGFSLVIRSDTMWGGVMRMVARAIALGNRAIYPNEIFDTTAQAAAFHAALSKGALRAPDLDTAVTRAYKMIGLHDESTLKAGVS